jgi:hypothetical protein
MCESSDNRNVLRNDLCGSDWMKHDVTGRNELVGALRERSPYSC